MLVGVPWPPAVLRCFARKREIETFFQFKIMAPKQATKGQKQIYDENQETIRFYVMMSLGTIAFHFVINYFLYRSSTTGTSWTLFFMSVVVQLGTSNFMRYMARATYSPDGRGIQDAGIDLNMDGGLGEYCKDIVILSACLQVLTVISSYFWSLYALAPAYALYLLWVNVLAPWFFAPAADQEMDEKKRKKKERKIVYKNS